MSYAKVYKIDNENGYAGNTRYEELVAPSNVKEIIADSEDCHCLQGENGGEVGSKLRIISLMLNIWGQGSS